MRIGTFSTAVGFGLALWVVLGAPGVAAAHAVGVEAKLRDRTVTVEAFYDDDTPAAGAKVLVTGPGGVVAEGTTDAAGAWAFPAPPGGKYTVAVDAGAGHRASAALTIPATTEPQPPAGEPVTISGGPGRTEFTGPMRLVWSAVGLVVIGGGTWILTRLSRRRSVGSTGCCRS